MKNCICQEAALVQLQQQQWHLLLSQADLRSQADTLFATFRLLCHICFLSDHCSPGGGSFKGFGNASTTTASTDRGNGAGTDRGNGAGPSTTTATSYASATAPTSYASASTSTTTPTSCASASTSTTPTSCASASTRAGAK